MTPKDKTILLVDDDKFLLDMYAHKFSQVGFTVKAESSVNAALQTLREGMRPDAILFDLIMPESDGFSLLQAIQKENLVPKAKKIALTNEMIDEQRDRAFSMGASDYIVKATKIPSEVVEYVDHLLK